MSGAFLPEARAFAELHKGTVRQIENLAPFAARRAHTLREINYYIQTKGPLDMLALFCHGWPEGIQFGFKKEHARLLARTVVQHRPISSPFRIALYCCDTARDDDNDRVDDRQEGPGGIGGFADTLCEAFLDVGLTSYVLGHTTLGHTTRNPHVRVFQSGDSTAGGDWLISPSSPLWLRWRRALRVTDLRLRIPFMTRAEIEAELTPAVA